MTIAEFCTAVSALGQKYHGSVTRWGSTNKHTVAVGGFVGDPHTWWLGVDMIYDTGANNLIVDDYAHALGLRVLHEHGHDHYQPADFPAGPVTKYP
jgi:hypothetical protein